VDAITATSHPSTGVPETETATAPVVGAVGQRTIWLTVSILILSAAAWISTVVVTGGMATSDMEATAIDGTIFYGVWVLMMAAMMLPAALPMFRLYSRMAGSKPVGFVGGYLILWSAAGIVAYLAYAVAHGSAISITEMGSLGRQVAIGLILAAALYQLSPLKNVCLRHCRSPLAFVMNHWHSGFVGAVRMGLQHGCWCLGCCAGLMVLLFAVGVMNIGWMAVLALVILAEKTLPGGLWIARAVSAAMLFLAVAFAASPAFYSLVTAQGAM